MSLGTKQHSINSAWLSKVGWLRVIKVYVTFDFIQWIASCVRCAACVIASSSPRRDCYKSLSCSSRYTFLRHSLSCPQSPQSHKLSNAASCTWPALAVLQARIS
ncbi:hypothetical protein L596_011971 [Steinernema carpocapsae]|uniref:Uncharacterized protein n=1 Tax=Steinernema carpocapsae TaxID=34508 RepID=A0A4U5NVQ0_STECR|nr:hypothetical protein L596_011971 [Steinernema carpocapsae]